MAITESTIFNKVYIYNDGGLYPGIYLFNDDNIITNLRVNQDTRAYDPSTDEFQIVADAINAETAVEIYSLEYDSSTTYTDETLPTYLSHWKEANPFHQARIASQSATDEATPRYLLTYQNLTVVEGGTPSGPIDSTDTFDNFAAMLTAIEADDWVLLIADLPTLADDEARYELRVVHYIDADGNFVAEASPLTSGTTRYSEDSETWHIDRTDDDEYFSILDASGHWQIYSISPSSVTSQIAGVASRKIISGSYYVPGNATPLRIGVSEYQYAKVERIELIHKIFSNYIGAGGYLQGVGAIEFPTEILKRGSAKSGMVTPAAITRGVPATGVTDIDQYGLRYRVDKDIGYVRAGINSTDLDWARADNNVGIIFLETYPQMELLGMTAGPNNVTATFMVDCATGLSVGDTLYLGTERLRLTSIDSMNVTTDADGLHDIITVERNVAGTMQTNAAPYPPIYGVVDQADGDVLRFITVAQTGDNKLPANFHLRLHVVP